MKLTPLEYAGVSMVPFIVFAIIVLIVKSIANGMQPPEIRASEAALGLTLMLAYGFVSYLDASSYP